MTYSLLNLFSISKGPQSLEGRFIEGIESAVSPDSDPDAFVVQNLFWVYDHSA